MDAGITLISGLIGLLAAFITLIGAIISSRRKKQSDTYIKTQPSRPSRLSNTETIKAPSTALPDYRRIKYDILEGLPVTCLKCGNHGIAKRVRSINYFILLILLLIFVIPGIAYLEYQTSIKQGNYRYKCKKCRSIFFESKGWVKEEEE